MTASPREDKHSGSNVSDEKKDGGLETGEDVIEGTGTLSAATFNLCKSAIGVGILALPYCMAQSGIVLGIILLVFCSLMASVTLHFLARIAANFHVGDYYLAGRLAYDGVGEISGVLATLMFLLGGGLIAYAQLSGTYLQQFLIYVLGYEAADRASLPFYLSIYATVGLSCCLILPLALLRDLNKLAPASIAGLVLMGCVCVLTVVDYLVYALGGRTPTTEPAVTYTLFRWDSGPVKAFTVILFAFCNHFTMLAVVPRMRDPTPPRRRFILLLSSSIVLVFYVTVAVSGYLHFGDAVNRNILLAPQRMSLPYAVAQLLVGLIIILSFPLLSDPARSCVEFLLTKWTGAPPSAHIETLSPRNLVTTGALVAYAGLVAMFFADTILTILGAFTALCGSLLMFVFPSMYFLRLSHRYEVTRAEHALALFSVLFGVLVLLFGTYFNALDTWRAIFAK